MIPSEFRDFLIKIREEVDLKTGYEFTTNPGHSITRLKGERYWGYYLYKNYKNKNSPWIFFGWAEEFEDFNTPFWIELDIKPSQRFKEINNFRDLTKRTHPRDSNQIIIPICFQECPDEIAEIIFKIAEETL